MTYKMGIPSLRFPSHTQTTVRDPSKKGDRRIVQSMIHIKTRYFKPIMYYLMI